MPGGAAYAGRRQMLPLAPARTRQFWGRPRSPSPCPPFPDRYSRSPLAILGLEPEPLPEKFIPTSVAEGGLFHLFSSIVLRFTSSFPTSAKY